MKIDTHTHIWDSLVFSSSVKRYTPDYLFTQKDLEVELVRHKIEKVVLVQPSFLENDNSLLLQTVKQNKENYRGVIVLDDFDTYSNLKTLLTSYDEMGIKGIRFNLIGKELVNFKEDKYNELFSILKNLDWHLEVHANEDDICRMFKDFKNHNLKIVLDHFARPLKEKYSKEFIKLLNSGINFYVKISSNYRFNNYKIDSYIKDLSQSLGKNRLLWGSDCPFTGFENSWNYKKSMDLLMQNELTYNLSEILDENAKELFAWE